MPVCMYPLMIIVAIVWFGQPAVRLLHTAGLPIYLPNPHLLVYTNAYYTVCGIRIWIDIWILCACVCVYVYVCFAISFRYAKCSIDCFSC